MNESSRGPFPFEETVDDAEVKRYMARDPWLNPYCVVPAVHNGRSPTDLASQPRVSPDEQPTSEPLQQETDKA